MAAGWVFAAVCTAVSIAYFSEIKAATQSLLGVQEPTAARVAIGEREGRAGESGEHRAHGLQAPPSRERIGAGPPGAQGASADRQAVLAAIAEEWLQADGSTIEQSHRGRR